MTQKNLLNKCPKTFAQVSVNTLLLGLAQSSGDQILARLEGIDRTVTDLRAETAWAQRDLLKALRTSQLLFEAQCPSLFTLMLGSRKATGLPGTRRYELRLYCEQPGAIHPLPNAPYAFEQPAEWLIKVSPYLRMLLTVLKHTVPLVGPVLGIAGDDLTRGLASELAVSRSWPAAMLMLQNILYRRPGTTRLSDLTARRSADLARISPWPLSPRVTLRARRFAHIQARLNGRLD